MANASLQGISTASSHETEKIDDALAPIRQGDVLRWEKPVAPWEVYSVVVTADCDIAQSKHAGIISYVPVLTLVDYWRIFSLPKKIERYGTDKFLPQAQERIKALQRRYRPDYPEEMSDKAIADLVRGSTPAEIVSLLNVPDAERSGAQRVIAALRSFLEPIGDQSLADLAELLAELRAANSNKEANNGIVLDELPHSVKELPGDAFFIGEVEPEHAEGYVAYLRLVRELPVDALALQPRDLRRSSTRTRRVARLRSPFVYRLTQQLAQVFSDIGLPSAYEQNRLSRAVDARELIRKIP